MPRTCVCHALTALFLPLCPCLCWDRGGPSPPFVAASISGTNLCTRCCCFASFFICFGTSLCFTSAPTPLPVPASVSALPLLPLTHASHCPLLSAPVDIALFRCISFLWLHMLLLFLLWLLLLHAQTHSHMHAHAHTHPRKSKDKCAVISRWSQKEKQQNKAKVTKAALLVQAGGN